MLGFKKSPWIIHYDASSCNGCDIEVLACLTPLFDVERLGVINTGNPKHADIFLVTGAVNEQSRDVIRNIYHQMPEPKVVVAVGICAVQRRHLPRVLQHLRRRGQRDPGGCVCAGLRGAAGSHHRRRGPGPRGAGAKAPGHAAALANSIDKALYLRAEKSDAPEILALQKTAYQSEAEVYGDDSLPALQQTLEELQNDFDRSRSSSRPSSTARSSAPCAASAVRRHRAGQPASSFILISSAAASAAGWWRRSKKPFPTRNALRPSPASQSERSLQFAGPGGLSGIQDRAVHARHHVGLSAKGT